MEIKHDCRWCQYPIDHCENPFCQKAHAQGFCGTGCRDAYFFVKEKEMERAANN